MFNNVGTLTLTNSTVSGNSAETYDSGGVLNTGTLTLARTLVSGNTSPTGPEIGDYGTITANNYNLFGHDGDAGVFGFSPGSTDLVPSESLGAILNATLANNGGPTRTHALAAGSPAIDASPDDADCAPTDQRGVRRPQRAACDIGAFEVSRQSPCDTASPTHGCTVNGVPNRVCRGTSGKDRIVGTKRNDRIFGRGGADGLIGNKGDDLLCGGDGNDTLFGNGGSDRLFGNRGNDKLKGGSGPDTPNGGSGADRLNGGRGIDTCKGGSGTDTGVNCETEINIP
ncbi:MAG: hypothetical protein M3436_16765 [Pseudomonadota bacterium]|nr:hypothetical protein [Pseudomonadota bacterium]